MAQGKVKEVKDGKQSGENFKGRAKKDKSFQSKVVVRRLPPLMTEDQFLDQISPVPDHDYFHYVKADTRLGQYAFSRAYLNFTQQDDIFVFKEKFDEYVFLDAKGNEYPAIVEFAPFQKIPKKRSKKHDTKSGTITTDADYLAFLENLKNPDESSLPTAELYLEEIESRDKELKANNGVPNKTTPLIEYIKARKVEQQKIREEKREERKRKEMEKKRLREEERRRKKAEKDSKAKERHKDKDALTDKEMVEENDEHLSSQELKQSDLIVQVLKNPEREKEQQKEQQKEHVPLPKNKSCFSWSNRDKERNKKEWDNDRQRDNRLKQKERTRINEKLNSRDKDRSRREKPDHNKYHLSHKASDRESNAEEPILSQAETKMDNGTLPTSYQSSSKTKRDKSCPGNVETTANKDEMEDAEYNNEFAFSSKNSEIPSEVADSIKSDDYNESKEQSKDPRVDRRIKNKDRPSLEIYRPGMRRFSAQRNSPQKEISTSTSNSSTPSPSPTPPLMAINSKLQVQEGEKGKNRKPAFPNDTASKETT